MNEPSITIGDRKIAANEPPFIIAEMSGNHNQSINRAMEIVDAAAYAGADAIKLQTYTPDTMTIRGAYTIHDKTSLWSGKELHQLYSEAYTPWEWHAPLFEHARRRGLMAFSSPFDLTSVDFLETCNVPCYKIASFENTDHILLKRLAGTGKPLIMSTGASTLADVDVSVRFLREHGCRDLVLLKCTSTYPASPENTNLRTIPYLSGNFDCCAGLSDHTRGIGVSIAAVAFGACVIEKHLTTRRADGGVDAEFSLEPDEFKSLVTEARNAWSALGRVQLGIQEAERAGAKFKRSLYLKRDLKLDEPITEADVVSLRPAIGIPTSAIKQVIGRTARRPLSKGSVLQWSDI